MIREECDVLVLGGGPAGSTVAALLADAGSRVVLLERLSFPRFHVGESLTPKLDLLFHRLGLIESVDAAGFVRMDGNYERWSGPEPEIQRFEVEGRSARGYQVERDRFDALLLAQARERGAEVRERTAATDIVYEGDRVVGARWRAASNGGTGEIRSRVLFDATGQRGLLGRWHREEDRYHRDVAVTRYWRGAGGPPGEAFANTVVEALDDAWIWSLPLARGVRNVTVFLERDAQRRAPGSLKSLYLERVASSRVVRPFLENAAPVGKWSITDSSWYTAHRYAGPGWALVGDAADFVDPLSSQGVFKAMSSAIGGAAVARTTLLHPEREAVANGFFGHGQRRFYDELAHNMARAYGQAARWRPGPFWRRRGVEGRPGEGPIRRPSAAERQRRRRELRRLSAQGRIPELRFRLGSDWRLETAPVLRRGLIEIAEVVRGPEHPEGLDLPREPRLGALLALIDGATTVRELVERYFSKSPEPRTPAAESRVMETIRELYEQGSLKIDGE